jgi:polyhydroxyalkanoate synthesis regulator protein
MLSNMIRFYGHTMQGMMGSYLEKNLQTFADMQKLAKNNTEHMINLMGLKR